MKGFKETTGPAWAATLVCVCGVFIIWAFKPYLAHLGFLGGFYALASGQNLKGELVNMLILNPIVGMIQFGMLLEAAALVMAGPVVSLHWLCRKYMNVLVRAIARRRRLEN